MDEKGFKYSILASGSSGNSFYLETPKKKILVDAGLQKLIANPKILMLF